MKKIIKALLTVVAIVVASVGLTAPFASASVVYNPGTGVGFAGKGDVQSAFGWKNAQLQANASSITFTYDTADVYTAVCTWTTDEGQLGATTYNISVTQFTSIYADVVYDARTQKQVNGFNLTGLENSTVIGTMPIKDTPCVGNEDGIDFDGIWTKVTLTGSAGGGLFAHYGAETVRI